MNPASKKEKRTSRGAAGRTGLKRDGFFAELKRSRVMFLMLVPALAFFVINSCI